MLGIDKRMEEMFSTTFFSFLFTKFEIMSEKSNLSQLRPDSIVYTHEWQVVKFLVQHFRLENIIYPFHTKITGLRTMPGLRQLPTLPTG